MTAAHLSSECTDMLCHFKSSFMRERRQLIEPPASSGTPACTASFIANSLLLIIKTWPPYKMAVRGSCTRWIFALYI